MNTVYQMLGGYFGDILVCIQQMQGLLEQEAEYLKTRDSDSLVKNTEDKEALAGRINMLTESLNASLSEHKINTGREGVEVLLSSLPPDHPLSDGLRERWLEINRLGVRCNLLNTANGTYIGLMRQHVQRSLDILHGQSSQEFVYGPDGVRHRPKSSRKLLSV